MSENSTQDMDLDLVVMGVDFGKGKRKDVFGSFLVGVYHEGSYYPISKLRTGFSE